MSSESLQVQRFERWRQTLDGRLAAPEEGVELINQVGLATLFPASPEIPNLYHAYMGDPEARTDSGHDTPSGHVYGWRWVLGRMEAAFYTAIVRNRPTWVSWDLLPAVIRLRGEMRSPQEVYEAGALSAGARRVAEALAQAGGVLSTGELRKQADFPVGKAQRTAYLKAVEELDTRLMLAKVFSQDDLDMRHALVQTRYPQHVDAAESLTREAAMDQLLACYLPSAVYAAPPPLARHLKLPEEELRAGLDRMVSSGRVGTATIPGYKGTCYVWRDAALVS